jgi:hypothetical protein
MLMASRNLMNEGYTVYVSPDFSRIKDWDVDAYFQTRIGEDYGVVTVLI